MNILVVEDEVRLAEAIAQLLRQENYTVEIANDGETGYDLLKTGDFDLAVLDIMLPMVDGLTILKKLREEKFSFPVLMLTARDRTIDKIQGLDTGADDYLAKPFDSGELLARVRALLRRKGEVIINGRLTCCNIWLDHRRLLLGNENTEMIITKKEADLLEYLILKEGIVSSKEQITEKLWGFNSEMEYNNVEVYISFLRKKLKHLGAGFSIKTIRGLGYSVERRTDVQ
ncbi:MAG TPA: response regulator transcription factor [Clostridia bacterium]|nr:response regulator transcription factor [Clostridia bacterium]HPQ46947.1 response regulator transcription factor [Clostridia bacterium]HRX42851.1 response regulator transcription factor [Clostridia bacterium]